MKLATVKGAVLKRHSGDSHGVVNEAESAMIQVESPGDMAIGCCKSGSRGFNTKKQWPNRMIESGAIKDFECHV